MRVHDCGTKYTDDVNYCPGCGEALNGGGASGVATIPAPRVVKKEQNVQLYIILGWVFFGLSFLFVPILFGAGAFIMGYLVRKSGRETHGAIMMILAVAGAILGVIIGVIVALW